MPVEFRCPECHKLLRVPDRSVGKLAHCPECNKVVTVTDDSSPPDFPQPSSEPPPVASGWQSGATDPSRSYSSQPYGASSQPGDTGGNNPFLSPTQTSGWTGDGVVNGGDIVARARSKIKPPAIILMVVWSLTLIFMGFATLGEIIEINEAPNVGGPNAGAPNAGVRGDQSPEEKLGALLGFVFIGLIAAACIYGGFTMMSLKYYPFAVTTSILSIVPCACTCWLFTIPFGIWALVVLLQSDVQQAFKITASQQ